MTRFAPCTVAHGGVSVGQKTISLKDAKAGMITAEPVLDVTGATLVREGVELNANWVTRLMARKIDTITIMTEDLVEAVSPDMEAKFAGSDSAVDTLFADVIASPAMQHVAGAAKRYRRQRLTKPPK